MSDLFQEFMQVTGVSEADARVWFQRLADDIRWWFPDPNPLGSLFGSYVGEQIAEYIEGMGQ